MQHKHYFVALLCGALCLTGCLKNEESLSVAEVRNAKANELNASAELKKAQATAETVLANAQAELLKAQAEVEKANALKIKAEADLLQVQADLAAVEVELARVNVDYRKQEVEIKKQELEMKKLELQQEEAKLQVLIAQCNYELDEWAAKLENMLITMEKQKYEQMLALVQAEVTYQQYLDGLDAAEQLAYEQAFQQALARYYELQSLILEAKIKINEDQIKIAKLQAKEEDDYEQYLEDSNAKANEIARKEALLAKAEEFLGMDKEELEDAITEINIKLIDAYNMLADANEAYDEVIADWNTLYNAFEGYGPYPYQYAYTYAEYANGGFIPGIKTELTPYPDDIEWEDYLEDELGAEWVKVLQNEEAQAWGWQFGSYDEEGKFVPFFDEEYSMEDLVVYPEDVIDLVDRGIDPDYFDELYAYTYTDAYVYVPAKTNVEALTAFINGKIADKEDWGTAQKENAQALAEAKIALETVEIGVMDAQIAEYTAYVEAVEPEFEAAQEAYDIAVLAEDAADIVEKLAEVVKDIAVLDDHELEAAAYEYLELADAYKAAKKAYKAAKADSTAAAKAVKDLEEEFITKYAPGKDLKTAEFNRDYAIAEAHAALENAQADLTTAIVTEYNTAKSTTEAKETAYDQAADLVDTKLAAYRAALVADKYHSTTETQKAVTDTKKEYDDAVTALGTAETERATAWTHYKKVGEEETGDKAVAYNSKKGAIETAQQTYDNLVEAKAEWNGRFADTADAYAEAKAAAEDALAAYEDATAAALEAKEYCYWSDKAQEYKGTLADAFAAEEKEALKTAHDLYVDAQKATKDAEDALEALDEKYPHYATYKAILDEDSDFMKDYNALLADIEDPVQDYGNGVDEKLSKYEADVDKVVEEFTAKAEYVLETIAYYEEAYRDAYVEGVQAFNEKDEERVEAYITKWVYKQFADYLADVKKELVNLKFRNEKNEEVVVATYIANLETELETLYKELAEIEEAYYYDCDNVYGIARYEQEISDLEDKIYFWELELEECIEIINEWLAQNAA